MDVIVQEVVSTIRAVEGSSLLDAPTLGRIVRAVMEAMAVAKEQDKRRAADTTAGTPTGSGDH
ncbi:MAG: hypothetical protein ACJ8AI_25775 [Rhodopila sp.]